MKRMLVVALIVVALAGAAFIAAKVRSERLAVKPPATPGRGQVAMQRAATPREAVTHYLAALDRKDYQAAFALLSTESQEAHPLPDFSQQARKGMTSFDVANATEGPEKEGQVVVSVPLLEDPARAGFTTVREGEGWKVVYLSGAPWFPYPEPVTHE